MMLDKLLIRWVLQPYGRLTRSQTLGVQGIVIESKNKVLLVRHSYVRGWHLPGGGVERDENLEQALRRELFEESGIELVCKPRLHGIFSNFERSVGDHIAVYVVRDWKRVRAPSSGFEIIENRFFELRSLPGGLIPGKITRTMKDAAVLAAEELGQVPMKQWAKQLNGDPNGLKGYFKFLAVKHPKSFAIILSRIMPLHVTAGANKLASQVVSRLSCPVPV